MMIGGVRCGANNDVAYYVVWVGGRCDERLHFCEVTKEQF